MTRLESYLSNLQRFGIRPGLERIRALLEAVGNPHLTYPVILVGGTNGKGSTCEYTTRLLAIEGRRIGLYTSPHLYAWNERIRILPGGNELFEGAISDADLDALFEAAHPYIREVATRHGQPTEFEVVTFLGLWHFARQKVDAAVIEVGLGGKWDATNVTEPAVSCVTHVALDHCDRLGDTVELIGADKVHIARPNRPFVTAETNPSVLEVFREYCDQIGAHFLPIEIRGLETFQRINATLALVLAREFANTQPEDWPVNTTILQSPPPIPGRSEIISDSPKILLDGANNPEGAEVLAKHLTKTLKIPQDKLILVLAILADKDWQAMTRTLAPLAREIIVTQSESARALPGQELADYLREQGYFVTLADNVPAAVEQAKALAGQDDWIVVTGSFTTIAEVPRA